MASVTSLDADMRKVRLDRYTPQAANETKSWVEYTLNEPLPAGDLLDGLKDGVALCKLANLVLPPPGIKFKQSNMPFTQRENIAHFLQACEMPPLNMPAHDRFLTVDLYDSKDPAQVVQCIQAFSRAANAINPSRFSKVIGPRKGVASPSKRNAANGASPYQTTGFDGGDQASSARSPDSQRAMSPSLAGGSSGLSRSGTNVSAVSSWSKKADEATHAPAWNIHQYGYMGGASQGNQGISFGARRQIVAPNVDVPSREEKERKRKDKAAAEERDRLEAERLRREKQEAEEEQARREEQERWEDETRKAREKEKASIEAERRRWEEQERRWKTDEEHRQKEEQALQDSNTVLKGQYLSQHQAELGGRSPREEAEERRIAEANRIKELERQLEEAKERERKYLEEREGRQRLPAPPTTPNMSKHLASGSKPIMPQASSNDDDEFNPGDDVDFLRSQRVAEQEKIAGLSELAKIPSAAGQQQGRPLPDPRSASPTRQLPQPGADRPLSPLASEQMTASLERKQPPSSTRPNPAAFKAHSPVYSSPTPLGATRTDRYLASNPAPSANQPQQHINADLTSANERAEEDRRRTESQQKTKAGGWASKSLLEREMERERERQREWEEQQIKKGRLTGPRSMGQR